MTENDDLEIGIAAGLDLPTALAIEDDKPQSGKGCGWVVLGSVAMIVWWLSR
jgi:hypothetical protein